MTTYEEKLQIADRKRGINLNGQADRKADRKIYVFLCQKILNISL